MEFPHTYFEDEVREGFYISGMIKRSWASQLEVLFEIDKVCKKYGIRWFADCGTLIGAVRHNGYIPWDDDLDICMLRPDYERFNQVAEKELPKGYVVLNCNNESEDYYEHLTRVANGHGLCFDESHLEKYHQSPYAIGVDIFVLDYIADDEEEEKLRKEILKLLMGLSDNIYADGSNVEENREVIAEFEDICDFKIDYSKNVKRQLFQMTEKIYGLYSDVGGKYVALMPYWINHNNHKYPAEYFDKSIMMPFEITEVPVPAAYDGVLKIEYGDYMKVVKGGGVHEYPCYEKQELFLIEQLPHYLYKYVFNVEDLYNEERKGNCNPRQQAQSFVQLVQKAHKAIIASLSAADYNSVEDLLTSCQNGAIQIGNLLERRYGEGFVTVKYLEEYCEILYQISLMAGDARECGVMAIGIQDIEGYLAEISQAIGNSIINDIPNKKEILFMPVKACSWGMLDDAWRRAKENPDNEVYVMPIPYYERLAVGELGEEYYEGDLFPDYLDVTDYRTYEIEQRHPDVIVIQTPYDQCNYTTTINSRYYTKNIKAHTDKLIYIPWFVLDEMNADSEKARKVMQYYCTVPGVVHSDLVIVQSDATRQEYIKCLTKFAGEETKAIWENKIVARKNPIDATEAKRICAANKEELLREYAGENQELFYDCDGAAKKVMLYNTSVASFSQNGVKLFEKIERSIEIFQNYKEKIVVIWRPHPQLRSVISSWNRELVSYYDELVDRFDSSGIGIYDTHSTIDTLVRICDAYYGDADGVAHRCEVEGMPTMIQCVDL